MNREIKFRVWFDGKMRTTTMGINKDGLLCCEGGSVVMQFTGLEDKNGKEIYFSDLVSVNGGKPIEVKDDYEFLAWLEKHQKESEIIGNICENPELLEE